MRRLGQDVGSGTRDRLVLPMEISEAILPVGDDPLSR